MSPRSDPVTNADVALCRHGTKCNAFIVDGSGMCYASDCGRPPKQENETVPPKSLPKDLTDISLIEFDKMSMRQRRYLAWRSQTVANKRAKEMLALQTQMVLLLGRINGHLEPKTDDAVVTARNFLDMETRSIQPITMLSKVDASAADKLRIIFGSKMGIRATDASRARNLITAVQQVGIKHLASPARGAILRILQAVADDFDKVKD